MGKRIRAAAIQLRSGIEPAANRAAAEPLLREAAANGASLIVTPECTTRLDRDTARMLAAVGPEEGDADLKAWGRLAQELGVYLLLGSTSIATGSGKAFNRSIFFNPDGKIAARYDKINLFDVQLGSGEAYKESASFEGGKNAVIVAGPQSAKLGLTICYDMRFPPLYSALARGGAEIITAPAAFTKPTGEAHWESLLRARAIETGSFVIAAAQGGKHEDGRTTWGHSMIIDPWGKILGILDHDEPGIVVADLDLDLVEEARRKIPAWMGGQPFDGPSA